MYTVICVLLAIVSILLVLIVLVQNSKGGGLAANFATGNQTFGVRQTADLLEKLTWGFAIALLVLCLAGTTLKSGKDASSGGSAIQNQIDLIQNPATNLQIPSVTPPQEGQQQQQPAEQQPQAPAQQQGNAE